MSQELNELSKKQKYVTIATAIMGTVGAVFVFLLTWQLKSYENTVAQNTKDVGRCIEDIANIERKLKDLSKNKECECTKYNEILQEHKERIKLLDSAIKNMPIFGKGD